MRAAPMGVWHFSGRKHSGPGKVPGAVSHVCKFVFSYVSLDEVPEKMLRALRATCSILPDDRHRAGTEAWPPRAVSAADQSEPAPVAARLRFLSQLPFLT